MVKYEMPDGNEYEFASDDEATRAMKAWNSQFGQSEAMRGLEDIEPSIPGGPGGTGMPTDTSILGHIRGGLEGAAATIWSMPAMLGGTISGLSEKATGSDRSFEAATADYTNKYSSIITPSTEEGVAAQHAIGKVIDPLNAVMPNLQMMHAVSSAGPMVRPGTKPFDPKLEAALKESEARRVADQQAGSYKDQVKDFSFNPVTGRMEKGSLYIDPLTRQVVDQRQGTQGPTTPRVDERFKTPEQVPEERRLNYQAGEPLVTFPDGTTMTRAEWEQRGRPNPEKKLSTEDEFYALLKEEEAKLKDVDDSNVSNPFFKGDRNTNVEVDSVSGRPIFPDETRVDNTLVKPDGSPRYGVQREGENFGVINPDAIARLWRELSPEKKAEMNIKSAEELQNFVEMHERKHLRDREFNGTQFLKDIGVKEADIRANNSAREALAPWLADDSVGPTKLPDNFREPYEGAPRQIPLREETKSPAQLRAHMEQLQRTLESVNKKLADLEIPGADSGVANTAKLDNYKRGLEAQISKLQDVIERGRKRGFSFQPKTPSKVSSRKSKASTEDVPDRLNIVFKDEAEQLYQQARNEGKTDQQAKAEVANKLREADLEGIDTSPQPKKKKNSGVGKKQGGAVNFGFSEFVVDSAKKLLNKSPSFKEFAEKINRTVDDPVAKELYNKYYGKEIKDVTPEQAAVSKIPGLKETISPELQPLETMIERWKTETDISDSPSARALRENLSSGGRMTAARTGNSFIDWNVENILGETRRAQVVVKRIQNEIKGEANKLTGSLVKQFKTKGESSKLFVEAMYSMLKSEGQNVLPNINPMAKKFSDTLRKSLDDLGLKIQEELRSQGVEGFQWRPNYLAGVFNGPYRSLVKDSTGKIIGVVAGKTKVEATAAIDYVKNNMPDASFDMVSYDPRYDSGPGSLGARYGKASEVLELLKNQDATAKQLQEHLSDYYAKVQENYMGYKQHFKPKTGVFGSEGNRPWGDALSNARDLLEAQLGIIDHGYHWLAEQKIKKDMDSILTNPDIALPESKRYVNEYLDHAFGRTEDKVKVFDDALDLSARVLGISPSAFKEMAAVARNTALTGTLGISGGFVLTQFVQVPQALSIGFARAAGEGFRGSHRGSSMMGGWDLVNGINGKFENMSTEGRYFFKHFTENGVMDPHLVEHTIHRKIVSTTGMNPVQKAVWESVNGVFKGAEVTSGLIGKLSIEKPESWTRGTFAMTMAHYYKSAGMSLKEAAIKADKDTSVLFVDYSSQERAMMFQRMGEMGKLASTVSTFKMNNLNQWFTFTNKKMYGALAALALTSWFTTGMFGMPLGDEAEFGATWLKSKGYDIPTPREYMLSNVPSMVSFGPLSKALTPFGGPDTSMHRKFAQDNVVPDDLVSFIYPLLSFYTNKIEKSADWVKSGFAKQEGAVLAREMVPGNLKYGVDYLGLTNEKGYTIDPNQIHDVSPAHYKRSKNEWKLAAALGITSQDEFLTKQINQLDKMSEQAWKVSTKKKIEKAMSAYDNGDKEKFSKLVKEALKYNPAAAEEITKYIQGHATASNMTLEQQLQLKFAKGATHPHGVNRLNKFRQMQENR